MTAERGHSVLLLEAAAEAGGQVRLAALGPRRRDLIGIVDWRLGELERLGVELRFNSYAEPEDVLAEGPEAVILATGGLPDTDVLDAGSDLAVSTLGHPVGRRGAGGERAGSTTTTAAIRPFRRPRRSPGRAAALEIVTPGTVLRAGDRRAEPRALCGGVPGGGRGPSRSTGGSLRAERTGQPDRLHDRQRLCRRDRDPGGRPAGGGARHAAPRGPLLGAEAAVAEPGRDRLCGAGPAGAGGVSGDGTGLGLRPGPDRRRGGVAQHPRGDL